MTCPNCGAETTTFRSGITSIRYVTPHLAPCGLVCATGSVHAIGERHPISKKLAADRGARHVSYTRSCPNGCFAAKAKGAA